VNVLLWIVQVLLALHTAMGAVWKSSNSEQTVPALQAIPHGIWLALIGVELLCSVGLVAPALGKRFAALAPIAAASIAAEMLLFSGLLLSSGSDDYGSLIYWLVVAAVCGFVVYGRRVLKPS
jgi:hypothetical protein